MVRATIRRPTSLVRAAYTFQSVADVSGADVTTVGVAGPAGGVSSMGAYSVFLFSFFLICFVWCLVLWSGLGVRFVH